MIPGMARFMNIAICSFLFKNVFSMGRYEFSPPSLGTGFTVVCDIMRANSSLDIVRNRIFFSTTLDKCKISSLYVKRIFCVRPILKNASDDSHVVGVGRPSFTLILCPLNHRIEERELGVQV